MNLLEYIYVLLRHKWWIRQASIYAAVRGWLSLLAVGRRGHAFSLGR